jgi:spermidine synthase
VSRSARNRVLFLLFFFSGMCGLAYQVVWLRLAFASFGIITPVMSVVISVFMLGLALGSWGAGRWIGAWTRRSGMSAIYFYACAELVIGASAFAVPSLFRAGSELLLPVGGMDSARYLFYSALVLGGSILPWCIAMGATFPLMMAFVREVDRDERASFSFLYLANVIGAMTGTALTAVVLIELLGFRATLAAGASVNVCIAALSVWLGIAHPLRGAEAPPVAGALTPDGVSARLAPAKARLTLGILFLTGFCSMGAEVVWIRSFTPVLGNVVYSFAAVLFVYLLATWSGSFAYRWQLARARALPTAALVAALAVVAWFPIVFNDPRLHRSRVALLVSIAPFCALLGYLTPKLVDQYSEGSPRGGGRAYALNVLGSIFGPLAASYLILPWLGARLGLALLALPFVLLLAVYRESPALRRPTAAAAGGAATLLFLGSLFVAHSLEEGPEPSSEIRRDYTATVVSAGHGMNKQLLVNGIGMTALLPETKVMAHMPLAFLSHEPESALVICLGMGTTFRSLRSWGIDTTAVELVESVRDAFPYYFDDAQELLRDPEARIVVDDGRRFLQRSERKYDVITIDPAPPTEAAGSSLLYSSDFYRVVKSRLKPGGILQHWASFRNRVVLEAVTRSLTNEFPHVKAFRSTSGWGVHFVASEEPLETPSPGLFLARMPEAARRDLVEWNSGRYRRPKAFIEAILSQEVPVGEFLAPDSGAVITDDRPFNEYFLLRRFGSWMSPRLRGG